MMFVAQVGFALAYLLVILTPGVELRRSSSAPAPSRLHDRMGEQKAKS